MRRGEVVMTVPPTAAITAHDENGQRRIQAAVTTQRQYLYHQVLLCQYRVDHKSAISGGEDRMFEAVKPMPGVGNAGSVRGGPLAWVLGSTGREKVEAVGSTLTARGESQKRDAAVSFSPSSQM
jgi:hypothetical protein